MDVGDKSQKALDLALQERLTRVRGSISIVRQMFSKQALSDGLEVSAAQALFYLAAEPGQTVTQIARKMHLTHPAISYAMKDLVGRGLADWTHGPQDQRTREYRLTDAGWSRIEMIAGD